MDGSGAFFRRMVESSVDGIWVFDPEGRTLYANPRAAELLGRAPEEMAGLPVTDALDADGQQQFRDHLDQLRQSGRNAEDVECSYVRKDGTPVLLMVGESTLHDEDGRLVGYVHRLSEDAERRALLHELSVNRAQLDEAQAIARVASWDLDLVTEELTWSRQMYAMLGVDPASYVPSRLGFLEHVVEADRPAVFEAVEQARHGQGEYNLDCRMRRADGTVGWFRGLGRLSYGEDGTPVRLGGTLQDITDVKEVELQLLDSVILNALMQVMATAANESATLVDALEAIRQQLLAHDDWQRAVGFSIGDDGSGGHSFTPYLLGDGGPDLWPNELERSIAERVVATGGTVFEEDAQPQTPSLGFLLTLDGEPILAVVITAKSPFERHDMLRSMVGQVSDQLARVANRERAAAELAAARDTAMEASRLKSEFLAMMSHEIRTPMNGVIGLNELLLRTELDPHQRRLAQGVQIAGKSLLGLINDILDFSKIEAGELELEVVDFDLRSVFDQVTAIMAATARDKGIALEVDIDAEVPDRLVGDPTRLGQVVSNLMSNAVKFTNEGEVHVRASLVDRTDDGLVVRVEVSDTGIGVSADQRDRLFEAFRQADASTTRTFGGTGLGLAIARRLVGAIGGEIGVDSEPGKGSTFWFTGRFGETDPQPHGVRRLAPPPAHAAGDRPRLGHVLVAEDNEINQLVALGLLEAIGYSSDVVANGEQAVAKAASGGYDAVLMDLQMPGMDGYAAARQIRDRERAGQRVPIIAMTASAITGERERCLDAGMDDFLTKPVDTERLGSVLRTYVSTPVPGEPPVADTASNGATPVLDPTRLQELRSLGDHAAPLIERAISNFLTALPSSIAELEQAAEAGDSDALRSTAHRLRGSALNLGTTQVAELTLQLETMGDDRTPHLATPVLEELREAAVAATSALEEHRAPQSR